MSGIALGVRELAQHVSQILSKAGAQVEARVDPHDRRIARSPDSGPNQNRSTGNSRQRHEIVCNGHDRFTTVVRITAMVTHIRWWTNSVYGGARKNDHSLTRIEGSRVDRAGCGHLRCTLELWWSSWIPRGKRREGSGSAGDAAFGERQQSVRWRAIHAVGDGQERGRWSRGGDDAALLPIGGRVDHEIGHGGRHERRGGACRFGNRQGVGRAGGPVHARGVLLRGVRGRGAG